MPNEIGEGIRELGANDPARISQLAVATSVRDALRRLAGGQGDTFARNAALGTPTTPAAQLALQGTRWNNTQLGYIEAYYAQYDVNNNPQGAMRPGWYYHSGPQPTINRRQTANITLAAGQEASISYSTAVESNLPAIDWSNGYFIANRPVRVSFEFMVNFSHGGSGAYVNPYLRKSTRSDLFTRQRIFKYGSRVDSIANVNPMWSGELSMNTDQAFSIGAVMSGNGSVQNVDDGAVSSNYIILRELPTPPRVVNW